MSDLRKAAQQALEALDDAIDHLPKPNSTDCGYAVTALRAALAQKATSKKSLQVGQEEPEAALAQPAPAEWRELVQQLVACHADDTCPAVEWAKDMLAQQEQEQEPVAFCDPAEYDDFQGAVRRNCAAANSPKRHAPVTMETVYETIINWDEGGGKRSRRELARRIVSLYTHPPRREWQGLTEEDIWTLAAKHMDTVLGRLHFARAIEAALRSKNQ